MVQANLPVGILTLFKHAWRMQIKLYTLEQGRKNQNHAAEHEIHFFARHWKLQMQKKKVPT
jgi:hypothetical protein